MKLIGTSILGVKIVESDAHEDGRGAFSRLFCAKELKDILGMRTLVQINHSMTRSVGAIRGLHYQKAPHAEMKIVRCLKGRVFDVAVDLRQDSPTFLKWNAVELTPQNHLAYVIPEGCAHGFQVLEEDSQLLYLHSEFYTPQAEAAVRFDDPKIAVHWPLAPTDISARDLSHPALHENFRGIIL
jgi:dTDP-4-dehydrorhamnose 3,5-epimerase